MTDDEIAEAVIMAQQAGRDTVAGRMVSVLYISDAVLKLADELSGQRQMVANYAKLVASYRDGKVIADMRAENERLREQVRSCQDANAAMMDALDTKIDQIDQIAQLQRVLTLK